MEKMTVDDLRRKFIVIRQVWEPFAKKDVNELMKDVDYCEVCEKIEISMCSNFSITHKHHRLASVSGLLIPSWNKKRMLWYIRKGAKRVPYLVCNIGHAVSISTEIRDRLRSFVWDADVLLSSMDQAIGAIAHYLKRVSFDFPIGEEISFFRSEWTVVQDRYAKARYGIDDLFD